MSEEETADCPRNDEAERVEHAQKRCDSRWLTMWNALLRSKALMVGKGTQTAKSGSLSLHVIGADCVEANEDAPELFIPLARKIFKETNFESVEILLNGPNVPLEMHGKVIDVNCDGGQLLIRMDNSEYHESSGKGCEPPAMAFLFNAGIWGYDSWKPTLLYLGAESTPTVVTSYNQWEAEDDIDTIQETGQFLWLWEPEENPFRSLSSRESGIPGRLCCENHFWQCFRGEKVVNETDYTDDRQIGS